MRSIHDYIPVNKRYMVENRIFLSLAGPRKKGASRPPTKSSSKKILVYALIGIIAVSAVSVSMFARSSAPPANPEDEAQNRQLEQFKAIQCGSGDPNSTQYISELALPSECEAPLGIEVSNGKVWYVSGKQGLLGSYDTAENKFGKEYTIPSWPARAEPFGQFAISMSWDVKVDRQGNVWFTDQQNNAVWRFKTSSETFDVFMFPGIYPSSLDFDSNGNVYVGGFRTKSIWFGEVAKMKNGTSEGITEIKLPLAGFSGYDERLISGGSVSVDNERNAVWTALVSYPDKGQLFRYDIESKKVDTFDVPPELKAPSSVALDGSGNLWVTDHGSSTFFVLDPATGNTTSFVTSIASPRVFGGQVPPNAYTLPYWIEKSPDGSMWFNEHAGNKIARFDPEEQTLVEYWIPTQNPLWGACPEGAETCGLANALQFAAGQDGQVWFTEWTENKIGKVDAKQLPFSVDATPEITVARGDSAEIRVTVSGSGDFDGRMMASGTFTRTGVLGNSSGIFSQEPVSVGAGESKHVSYTFTAAQELKAGQYVMMVGAGNDDVSYMKAVRVNVV